MIVCRFNKLLKKYGVGNSLQAGQASPSSGCASRPRGVRRRSKQHVDSTKFFTSRSSVDALRATVADSAVFPAAMQVECRPPRVDEVVSEVIDWTSVRLIFVVLDVLLLARRLARLCVEFNGRRGSAPGVGQFWPLSDGCAKGEHVVDGVDPAVTGPGLVHVRNHVGSEVRGPSVNQVGGLTNSSCAVPDRYCSEARTSTSTSRRRTSGSSSAAMRRRLHASPDIVPRLVCLVALLAALFYARAWTLSRGVLWLRGALPSPAVDAAFSGSAFAVGRNFHDDVGVTGLANDFRQLQAFVDFFNRGKSELGCVCVT